ncbi:unnamed protein product [Linum tenue]|uniref:glucan endo-1,3-beta-D-glucosidase n=2 Tax=Linum tenue TaxID=586396 RepID=A0AAV0LHV7_9ROSI|nr:unnamed protein product [Linum tenue]CAI0433060.1 unnamed protein product [Linum tenue]
MLGFLISRNSPFMINPYPFFGCSEETLDYALFRPNSGVLDPNTKLRYTNMLDAQLDAVFSTMKLPSDSSSSETVDDLEALLAMEERWTETNSASSG